MNGSPGAAIAVAPPSLLAGQFDFQAAWARVSEKAGMPGVDGMGASKFARSAGAYLKGLESRLARDAYRPLPLRLAGLEKKKGARRLLRVPCVFDRITLAAAAAWIATRLNAVFDDASYAYRAGRGVRDALRAIA